PGVPASLAGAVPAAHRNPAAAARTWSAVPHAPNLSPWNIVANYPFASESVSVSSDGTVAYAVGGFDPNIGPTNAFNMYDPVADTWNTSRANVPIPLGGSGYSIVGQNIYLAGTWNGGTGSTVHYRYDIVADSWTQMADVPVAIYRPDAAGIGTNEYLVGGGNPFVAGKATKATKARKGPKMLHPSTRSPAVSYN